jgi:hypothetical protein
MIRTTWRRAAIAVLATCGALAISLSVAAPANASTHYVTRSCSKDGFTGWLWFAYATNSAGHATYIGQIKYRIYKGSNSGGNEADVDFNDNTTPQNPDFWTNNGVQDNLWHLLGGDYYRPGSGAVGVHFTFDKSWAIDPECGIFIPLP